MSDKEKQYLLPEDPEYYLTQEQVEESFKAAHAADFVFLKPVTIDKARAAWRSRKRVSNV